ncbi:hypothetical protein FNV43_RR11082 [Rhamnella rubrinervis]|uniref:Uncharacterized protein n=1 Tax=Rhamnella rubrinervis TaxID=2594499 RepID=A0A8K0H5L3_9ROSA|nr:hypothetical protein FNV43_RR11082 [Rhamnella rubrinervis]
MLFKATSSRGNTRRVACNKEEKSVVYIASGTEALALGWALILFSRSSLDQGLITRLMNKIGVGLKIPRNEKTGTFTSDK